MGCSATVDIHGFSDAFAQKIATTRLGARFLATKDQRFIWQCALAAAANDVVIGVCGLWGRREKQLEKRNGGWE